MPALFSQHSHQQVMEWHQKFSGKDELTKQIATQEERSRTLALERAEKEKQLTTQIDLQPCNSLRKREI